MDFYFIVTQLVSGFTMATLLFLVASGLTLIFGVGNIFNFAHGSFYMIGAYFGYQLVSVWKINFWIALVAAWWILAKTRPGRIARASAVDREMLGSLGVNVPLVLTVVFGLATALGGMAGALAAPLRSVTPGAGIEVIIDSLIVVVLGGMSNFWGAWLGAVLLGEVNAFAVAYLPAWSTLFSYLVMVVTLIFRPEGLFAATRLRKV